MTDNHTIRGVLFDLDGVIVDTLHYHYLAWKHMFEKYGGTSPVSELTVLLHEGRNSREILPILMEETGVTIPDDRQRAFIEEKRAYFRTIVHVTQYPGAFEVIDTLRRRGFKVALVTACALKNMQHNLNREEQAHFDFIITGDEVPRAKPFPDPYLTAARQLGLRPDECVVVENAPLGIESARNAGMICVAVETTLGKEYLTSADHILQKVTDLLNLPFLVRP
ncbi:MAG TPA: HAD family phosphatase [Verrucomicrobiae bacterium]|nr:HAD family phosphatase [Verrucomicrobiae bacterium]